MSDMIMDVKTKPRIDFATVKQMAVGRWHEILSCLTGLDAKYFTDEQRDCPISNCGGKDRYRFDNKNGYGTWYCNTGHSGRNAGDGFNFLEYHLNVGSSGALHLVAEYLGLIDSDGLTRKGVFHPVQPPELKQPKDDKASREEAIETTKYILDKCTESTTHPYLKAKSLTIN
jgi:putative DNA primase/helicase